jgi:hypothetical protein
MEIAVKLKKGSFIDLLKKYSDGDFTGRVEALIDKGVPLLQATVVAGDEMHGDALEQGVKTQSLDPMEFVDKVGSYARLDWAKRNLTQDQFLSLFPGLWRDADPDDSREYALPIWEELYRRNGNKIITDEKPLRPGKRLTVYRGQLDFIPGVAWSLSKKTAEKFALTGGMRMFVPGGRVIKGRVARENILAYITGRGEREVIVDPFKVKIIKETLCKN